MGGEIGAFAGGFARTLQTAMHRKTEDEYKKALIEQSKLQTKMLENKLKLAESQQSMTQNVLSAAFPGMNFGQPQTAQGAAQVPAAALQPTQAPGAAPAPGIPDMVAQGQVGGALPQAGPRLGGGGGGGIDINNLTPQQAMALEMVFKQSMDYTPPLMKRSLESQDVDKWLDLGNVMVPVDRTGRIAGKPIPKSTKYETMKVEGVGGGETTIPYDPYNPQGVQTKPPGAGMTPEKAGKINLIGNAFERVQEVENLMFTNGEVNREILVKGMLPGGGQGQGAILYSKMYQILDAALRMETGAQANESEIKTKINEFWPRPWDTTEAVKSKFKDLKQYVEGAAKTIDPTGEYRKGRSNKPSLKLNKPMIPPPPAGWRIVSGEKSPDGYPIVTDGKTKKRWGP